MTTKFSMNALTGAVDEDLVDFMEINGVGGAITIVLPLAGGDEFTGGVVVTDRLPDIKNVACEPKEYRDMGDCEC
jgi:hypothetical protein